MREEGKTTMRIIRQIMELVELVSFTFQYNFQVSSFSDRSTLNIIAYH